MANLQTYYHSKIDFQKVDQHTVGKWLIHGTERRKDNQLQSLEVPVEYHNRECTYDIKESEGNMFNPNIQGEHPEPETKHGYGYIGADCFACQISGRIYCSQCLAIL